ncbi:MAG: redoxin domain-containing protein, partial [Bacteroidetes bacterium]|nr:redoxin domain-containing protein [Bacteroidota bacterium]
MKKIAFAAALPLMAASAIGQKMVTITGTVTGDTKGYNKIYLYGTNVPRDSSVLNDGSFHFSFPYTDGCVPVLYTEYEAKVNHAVSPFAAMIDGPCDLKLQNVEITRGLGSGTWTGNQSAEDYQSFNKGYNQLNEEIRRTLNDKYPGKNYSDSVYRKEGTELTKKKLGPYVISFLKAHPDSYASVAVLRGQRSFMTDEEVKAGFAILSGKQKATAPGREMQDFITGLSHSAIGHAVANFTLPTPDGKSITFSNLKGKYVLVDFWASWCGPCKASFPHMKEVYQKYKGDRFEIYSISIDQDKDAWLKELDKQQLPWLQALDNQKVSSSGFAVSGVPTTYLISPEGKIMMKEVGFNPKGGAME